MKRLTLLLLILNTFTSYAGEAIGYVSDIAVFTENEKDYVIVKTISHITKPDCVSWKHNWGIELSSEASKGFLSILLTAQASQKTIRIAGAGICHEGDSGFELIRLVNIGPMYN